MLWKRSNRRSGSPRPNNRNSRRLNLESLEQRNLLAVNITAVQVEVNQQAFTVDELNNSVQVAPGDILKVTGVDYQVTDDSQGFAAFEGYVRQSDTSDTVQYDYADGRYGSADKDVPLAPGEFTHGGLQGEWELLEYADRLTIALVRYQDGNPNVEDRFHIKLAEGNPDFVLDYPTGLSTATVGVEAQIFAEWSNQGTGTYLTHTEVDIFRAGESKPIWVGTLSGVVDGGGAIKGEVLNNKDTDVYPTRWTPSQSGKYKMLIEVDPEDLNAESNEANNKHWFDVYVVDTAIVGTDGNDKIDGTDQADGILGQDGNDKINWKKGDDFIDGGDGNDELKGEDGNDVLLGGDGNNKLDGGDGNDRLVGGDGNDELKGGHGLDTLTGGLGNDELKGDDDADRLFGGDGNDELEGGNGNDLLVGGAGNDVLKGGKGRDIFYIELGTEEDLVYDLKIGEDRIYLEAYFADFAELLAAARQDGKDVRIELSGSDELVLKKIDLADLSATDFEFDAVLPTF